MNARWTKEEEAKLLKSLSNGKNIDTIAKEHNRSSSAVEMRIQKIVYTNITAGKSEASLSKILHLPKEKVQQYYFEHKGFLEKKSTAINNQLGIEAEPIKTNKLKGGNNQINKLVETKITPQPTQQQKISPIVIEPKKATNEELVRLYKRLSKQNKILKKIVDNVELKDKLKELANAGKIDKKIITYLRIK